MTTLTLLLALVFGAAASELSLGTAFYYEGRLERRGAPAEGPYDFEFQLWDREAAGHFLGSETRFDEPVAGGVFSVELDFGRSVATGGATWLEIRVREAGSGPFVTLSPRQRAVTGGATCVVEGDAAVTGSLGVGTGAPSPAADLFVDGRQNDGSQAGLVVRSGPNPLIFSELLVSSHEIDVIPGGVATEPPPLVVNGSSPGDIVLVTGGGSVGVGTLTPEARLHVDGITDTSLSTHGGLVLGSTAGVNLSVDANEIMARNAGGTSPLYLNADGGAVNVGGDLVVGGAVHLGYVIVELDDNDPNDAHEALSCPAGTLVVGGGCSAASAEALWRSSPWQSGNGWSCTYRGNTKITVEVICLRVQ